MGTNYYWWPGPFIDKVHIGKSSAGWCFSLHIYTQEWEDDKIMTLDDWVARWNREGSRIESEYGDVIEPAQMLNIVTKRSWERTEKNQWDDAMYQRNGAQPGPNGLVRHKIDGQHCVGNGEGTWDYIVGDFS